MGTSRHPCIIRKRRTTINRLLPVAGVVPGLSGALRPCGGGWYNLPLSSTEASVWLRELINPWSSSATNNIATHSARATVLSWVSKASVKMSLRRLAGYHIKPGDKSALEYSRDSAAPVLKGIEAIYIAIRAGHFRPDACRSDRWVDCDSLIQAVRKAADLASVESPAARRCAPGAIEVDEPFRKEACTILALRSGPMLFRSPTTPGEQLTSLKTTLTRWRAPWELGGFLRLRLTAPWKVIRVRKKTGCADGAKNAIDLVPPQELTGKTCFKHSVSRKLHILDTSK